MDRHNCKKEQDVSIDQTISKLDCIWYTTVIENLTNEVFYWKRMCQLMLFACFLLICLILVIKYNL
jgi:hypothetical protein